MCPRSSSRRRFCGHASGVEPEALTAGGEPLLHDGITHMLEAIKHEGLRTSVISNGWHLEKKADDLAAAGLDQIILSIDGATAKSHDKFRRLDGLFDRIVSGITAVRRCRPDIIVRVNTVVGRHNISTLCELWDTMCRLEIDQWSLIPLKRSDGAWGGIDLDIVEGAILDLKAAVQSSNGTSPKPRILGYGLDMFGRDRAERERLWHEGRNMTPAGPCHLVDLVRYYDPTMGLVYPCNCVPHRDEEEIHAEPLNASSFGGNDLQTARSWLRAHGHARCNGCEPVNAALGDQAMDLNNDPFGF